MINFFKIIIKNITNRSRVKNKGGIMSKLYEKYLELKNNKNISDKTLFLFKSGIFFIFLDEDARIASKIFNLKLTLLTEKVVKCGFPISSLEKYSNLFKTTQYDYKIIDTSKKLPDTIDTYNMNEKIKSLLYKISTIDINSLSVKEAYDFIENIKTNSKEIMECDFKEQIGKP